MQVLLIRHDLDGTMHWQVYDYDGYTLGKLGQDITAHLNTIGVRSLELIPATVAMQAVLKELARRKETSPET